MTSSLIDLTGQPVLIDDALSSNNPVTLTQLESNYINKVVDLGLQSSNTPLTLPILMNNQKITQLDDGVLDDDAVTLLQSNTLIS